MKIKYRYFHFEVQKPIHAKSQYTCVNNKSDDILGYVDWYSAWRTWAFSALDYDLVLDAACLRDIANFMDQLKQTR